MRAANPNEKICIFMDNLGVHISDDTKKEMRRLKFRWVYNVAYSPEYNPIELVFSQLKANFKAARARKLVGLTQNSHRSLIVQALQSIKKKSIVKCVEHC